MHELNPYDAPIVESDGEQKSVRTFASTLFGIFGVSFLHFLAFVVSYVTTVITWQLILDGEKHYLIEYTNHLGNGITTILGFPLAIIPWSVGVNPLGVIPNSLVWGVGIYQISKQVRGRR